MNTKTKTRPVCTECGSTEIKADAWAEWSDEQQDWILCDTYESTTHCEQCGGECSIDWE